MTRTATCTDGRQRTFTYDGEYLIPYAVTEKAKRELFKEFPRMKACVLYTEIVIDSGSRFEMSWVFRSWCATTTDKLGIKTGSSLLP